jgi:hypothetical protein
LRAVKADLKILVFQDSHTENNKLPERIEELFTHNLAHCGHHHPGYEIYLFIQFDHHKAKLFLWQPTSCDPLPSKEDVNFKK